MIPSSQECGRLMSIIIYRAKTQASSFPFSYCFHTFIHPPSSFYFLSFSIALFFCFNLSLFISAFLHSVTRHSSLPLPHQQPIQNLCFFDSVGRYLKRPRSLHDGRRGNLHYEFTVEFSIMHTQSAHVRELIDVAAVRWCVISGYFSSH